MNTLNLNDHDAWLIMTALREKATADDGRATENMDNGYGPVFAQQATRGRELADRIEDETDAGAVEATPEDAVNRTRRDAAQTISRDRRRPWAGRHVRARDGNEV